MKLVDAYNKYNNEQGFDTLLPYIKSLTLDRNYIPKVELEIYNNVTNVMDISRVIEILKSVNKINYKNIILTDLTYNGISVDFTMSDKTVFKATYTQNCLLNKNNFILNNNNTFFYGGRIYDSSTRTH